MEIKLETLLEIVSDLTQFMAIIAIILLYSMSYVFFAAIRFHYNKDKDKSKSSLSQLFSSVRIARKEQRLLFCPRIKESEFLQYAIQKPILKAALNLPATITVIFGGLLLYFIFLAVVIIFKIKEIMS